MIKLFLHYMQTNTNTNIEDTNILSTLLFRCRLLLTLVDTSVFHSNNILYLTVTYYFQSLRKEIDRRIKAIPRIQCEPNLNDYIYKYMNKCPPPSHCYRFKAVNDSKTLGKFCLLL